MGFDPAIIEKARQEREVDLTTFGRTSGKPSRKTLWINTDGTRLFVRSGQGLGRDWPRNVLANGRALLHIAGHDLPVRAVHVTDPALARQVSAISSRKYGTTPQQLPDGQLTPAEQATFELVPAEAVEGGDLLPP